MQQPPTHENIFRLKQEEIKSRDSSVGIATGYGLDAWGSILGKNKGFVFSIASIPALRPTYPCIQWVPGPISPRVKRPKRETDKSSPFSAEVKNGGAIPPLPLMSS
jgi:hypothetical protein